MPTRSGAPVERRWSLVRAAASCRGVPTVDRLTVTVKLDVAVFALESLAVHVTFVRPIRKRLPDFGVHVAGTAPSRSSCAVTR